MKKAILKLGYSCNNNCVFCHAQPKKKYKDLTFEQINKKITLAGKQKIGLLVLSGGEPTVRKDFWRIVDIINRQGSSVGLVTNGRMLSNKRFVGKLKDNKVHWIYLSLHGHNQFLHDSIVRAKSFRQIDIALHNLRSAGIKPNVNVVVNKLNLHYLKDISKYISKYPIKKLKYSFIEPILDKRLVPRLDDAARQIGEALEFCRENKIKAGYDGIPLCLMKASDRFINLYSEGVGFVSEVYEDRYYASDFGNTKKLESCNSCKLRNDCFGIYKEYIKIYNEKDVEKIIQPK